MVENSGPATRGLVRNDYDAVCLVKRYASDASACQKPVLVLPHTFLSRLPTPLPEVERPLAPLPVGRRKSWLELAKFLMGSPKFAGRARAVQYLLKAAEGRSTACCPKEPLPWHEREPDDNIVRLQDASLNSYLRLHPVNKFKATLRR